MALEAFALPSVALRAPADLPHPRCSRHVLVLRLFPVAGATSLLLPETTGSTKTQPVLST